MAIRSAIRVSPRLSIQAGGDGVPFDAGGETPSLLAQATAYLKGIAPTHFWDFTQNRAIYNGVDIGPVTATPGWTVSGGALVMSALGLEVTTQTISCTNNVAYPCTMLVESVRGTDTGAGEVLFHIARDGNNRSTISVLSTDVPTGIVRTAAANVASVGVGTAPAGATIYRAALRIANNDVNMAVNGALGTQDTVAALPTDGTLLYFGSQAGAAFAGAANYIRRAALFNSALTDAQLALITA